jgi:putative acetyltransferase
LGVRRHRTEHEEQPQRSDCAGTPRRYDEPHAATLQEEEWLGIARDRAAREFARQSLARVAEREHRFDRRGAAARSQDVSNLVIRPEAAGDRRAIFEVNARAFPQPGEAKLVDALRTSNAATISLVAESAGRIVGHILFSPVRVEGEGSSFTALGRAPMAVVPACQRAGVGSALVRAGLDACRRAGHGVVFVLGHPTYYPRFGFEPAAQRGLHYEGGPDFDAAFFVAELTAGALAGRRGVVHYRPEFAQL